MSETDMYRRAKFHADRCHRRRDICNRTDTHNYRRFSTLALRLSVINTKKVKVHNIVVVVGLREKLLAMYFMFTAFNDVLSVSTE